MIVGALSFVVLQAYFQFTAQRARPSSSTSRDERRTGETGGMSSRAVRSSELSIANGEDGAPIYIGVKDPFSDEITVFDMSSASDFYGPGGPYHIFAGRHATHGLAKSSVSPADVEGNLSALSAHERDTHMQWYAKYSSKYPKVGYLLADGAAEHASSESFHSATANLSQETKKDA